MTFVFPCEVLDLRTRGSSKTETMDYSKLYYVSGHTLNGDMVSKYGKQRILSTATSLWLSKKLVHNGVAFDDTATNLTEDEINALPNGKALSSVDALSWEVTVRSGDTLVIHPDHCNRWQKEVPEYADRFNELATKHNAEFKDMLASVIAFQQDRDANPEAKSDMIVEADLEDEPPEANPAIAAPAEWASLEALKNQVNIIETVASEEADVIMYGDDQGLQKP